MWSVATEWQIYFLFPLLLLPVWRRYGILAAVVSGFAVGMAPHWLFHGFLDAAFPWFIGLFALGMAGATINYSEDKRVAALRSRIMWGPTSLALWVAAIGFCVAKRGWYAHHQMFVDPIIGLGTMSLLIQCTNQVKDCRGAALPIVARFLSSPQVVWIGTFSYSLYLMHYPMLQLSHALVIRIPAGGAVKFLALIISLPAILVACFGFHLLFERHFMSGLPETWRNRGTHQPFPRNSASTTP